MTDYEKVADAILDEIMDMVDNDERVSLETIPIIAKHIRTAVENEREECAKVAKTFDCNCMSHEGDDKEAIAQAIRTRGKDTPQNG